ncbi:energy-converting hydrogenase A subunit A EhaA [Methanobrevibacter sp. TMH8]|uniref:energy-converting hydrogenase A subunit A EhaA n=1 Tax=Methanobrevibacter sp. TMH8 TaxID=2848611 RepID=UPI001CC93336|nr:energy-converting hydrogenase A subunit A EhaA [Methanobrevibacter sp. TMH8]MBZ9571322.1 energy-converting hydrogenase A subunit A EhaA [Methanobrevibacter sp. TMH8]
MILHANETYLILSYLVAAIVSIVIALGLGLPALPKKPIRFSFDKSAIFPTPIFAIGFLAICFSVNFFWIYNGLALAVFWGIISALFVKFAFDIVFPKPPEEVNDNDSNNSLEESESKAKEIS